MKNKKIFWLVITLIIIISIISLIAFNMNKIPDGYIAVFHGGVGEQTYETYIYKINNGQANYGFKYINVTSTTSSYGSDKWNSKITKHGTFDWTEGAFNVAKENNAYSYVTLPNSDKVYTIDEFVMMFSMD